MRLLLSAYSPRSLHTASKIALDRALPSTSTHDSAKTAILSRGRGNSLRFGLSQRRSNAAETNRHCEGFHSRNRLSTAKIGSSTLYCVKWNEKIVREFVEKVLEAEFANFLTSQVDAYVQGQESPAEIAPAIMNLADDHLSGREISVRAGDYISLQKYFRKMQQTK